MTILYDAFLFRHQHVGGVNRYFTEVVNRLPSTCRPLVYGAGSQSLLFPTHRGTRKLPGMSDSLWSQCITPRRLKDTDLFHPTYFELTPPLEWSNVRTPVVLTVYDFIFARFAHRVPGSERLLALQAMALRRADRLLCISQSTMSDLIERFPECEPRARLTRLGASLPQAAPAKSARPYLIFVGARTFYKNFGWCITAVEHLLSMGEDVELVVAGTPWTPDELPLIVGLAAMGRLRLVAHPDDASLAAWIKGARALLYPSAWEGFGLPALEAIALGTPVVALNASSLPEVVGPGGMLIEPATAGPQALAEASLALLRDSESRERIVRDGLRHAGRFSWEHAAADALAAYEELAA